MLRLSLPHLDETAIAAATAVRSGQVVQGQGAPGLRSRPGGLPRLSPCGADLVWLYLAMVALGIGRADAVLPFCERYGLDEVQRAVATLSRALAERLAEAGHA